MNATLGGGRLRLLHAGPLPPPWSGIGVSLQQLVSSQPIRAHDPLVLDTSSRGLPGDPRRSKRPTPRRLTRHAHLALQTARLVRRHRVQVLHFHGSSHDLSLFGNALCVLSARGAGARTVWHLHEDLAVVAFPGRHRLTRAAFSALMRLPDTLAVLSENARAVASAFVDARKLTVLPPTCSPDLAELPLARDSHREVSVLFVGWLTADKGIHDLLDVAERVKSARPRITFRVMGSGMTPAETAAVEAAIERRGLRAHVALCGVLTGSEKQRMFAEADLLFLPTHWDAFPVVILEAMAAGLPIVSTLVGGVPLLVEHGQGGLLAAVGDTRQLAECVSHLALARDQRMSMGSFNRQRFLSVYHPDVVGQAAVDLYCRLLANATR